MSPTVSDLKIWQIVKAIPKGSILSYGEVARRAGYPKGARQVARALKIAPEEMNLPWHRVVGAGHRISIPAESAAFKRQVRLLKREGFVVKGRRIVVAEISSLDRALWG
jgi:methylated-DNA-protein-cysteine methyltransferase related protein